MAENPCLDLVRQSIPDMSVAEMSQVIDLLKAEHNTLLRSGLTPDEAAKKASVNVAESIRAAIKIERRNAVINRRVRLEALEYLNTYWQDDPTEGALAILYGSPKARFGSRNSVGAAQSANFRKYVSGLERDLREAGLIDVLRRREMDDEITRALWYIEDKDTLASIPSSAVQAARILEKWREIARLDANRAGAWITKAKNYITRQTHAPDRIQSAGIAEWKKMAMEVLDFDRMFPDGPPENLDEWLTEAFNNITTGVRPRSPKDATAERMSAFKGPRNLARRVSADRVFYFKNPEAWSRYNKEFGQGSFIQAFINDLHRRSEATGMLQILGTNPEYNFDSIIKALRTQLSRTDPKALERFDAKSRRGEKFENAMRELNGFTRTIASSNISNVGAGVRVMNVLSSLGAATLSAVGDVPIKASLLRYQGNSFLGQMAKGIIDPFKRILSGAGSSERQALVNAVGHFNDVTLRNLVSRWSPDETTPGKLHSATNTFFKWNLLGPFTEEGRRGALESMGTFFGGLSDRVWTELSERTQRALQRFSIGEKEWEIVRHGIALDDQEVKFITPDKIRELSLDRFTEMAAARIEAVQRGLLEKVQRRMKADEKEQGWIDKRHADFTKKLEDANERLLKLAERRTKRAMSRRELLMGRVEKEVTRTEAKAGEKQQGAFDHLVEETIAINKKIGELTIELEKIRDWWKHQFDFDRAPAYGKQVIREAGVQEGTLKAKQRQARHEFAKAKTEFLKKMKETTDMVEGLRERLTEKAETEVEGIEAKTKADIQAHYDSFNEHWQAKYKELREYMTNLEERIKKRRDDTAGDLDKLGGQIERVLDDSRNELANRMQRLYADEVDSAIITPDARALAFVRRGTQAGTTLGESLRLFWQFKTFPIGVVQRALMREFYGYNKGRGGRLGLSELQGLALLLLTTTAFGYLSMTLKDLARGRLPRPPDHWKTWRDAMAQGGFFGIYGDFLTGTQARFGSSFVEMVGGPSVGKVEDAYDVVKAIQTGEDPRAKALRFAVQQIPGNNLFYTKAAVDYLFLYEAMEAMNPGYLRRFERKITEETGTEWWLRPTEAAQ